MAAQNEVAQGVSEVASPVVIEKCGLEMSSYQDLPIPNGINHVGGESSLKVDSIAAPLDLVAASETMSSGDHADFKESIIIANGNHREPAALESDSILEVSDATVENQGSLMKEHADIVVAATDSEITHDGELGVSYSESVAASETMSSGDHADFKESIVIANGNHREPAALESDGIVEVSDVAVENQGSLMKEQADVVVAATDSEITHDGGLGVSYVESVVAQTESAPSVLPTEDQPPQIASTDSPEQLIGAVTTDSEVEVVSETSIQHLKSQESKVALMEANTGVRDSVELKGVSSFVDNCGDRIETTEEAISRESVESPDNHDSQGVELNMNAESSPTKDLERVAHGIDYIKHENMENMSSEISDELPHRLDSRNVVLASSDRAGQNEDLEGSTICDNSSDNHSKTTKNTNLGTSDELSLCPNSEEMISKVNAESGESKDLDSIVPETNNTNKDGKGTVVTIAEASDDTSVDQDSRDMVLVSNNHSGYVSGSSDIKEAGDEYKRGATQSEVCPEPVVVQECEAMELKQDPESLISSEFITPSLDVKTGDESEKSDGEQCETSDGLVEAQGATDIVEADGYQLEEAEYEKSNAKEQKDFESFHDNSKEHEVVSLDAHACQSEDVKIMTQSSDLQHEAVNAQQLEEVESTQVHDTEIVPQHDEPCDRIDVSLNFQFGSLGSGTEMNSKPDQSNESFCSESEAAPANYDVEYQAHTVSEGTKLTDDVELCAVDDSLRTETTNKPGENDEDSPSGCQDVTIVHENDLHAPGCSSAETTDDNSACRFDGTRSGNIESVVKLDAGVTGGQNMASFLASKAGLEVETFGTIDSRAKAVDIQDDDAHAEDVKLASKTKTSSGLDSDDVHPIDAMATMIPEISDKEGGSNLFPHMTEVKSAGDDLNVADKSKEVNLISQDIGAINESLNSEVSADLTRISTSATSGQELEESMPRPFNFLVKIPRFDDEKLREQVKRAQLEVDEKTQHRDNFKVQIQKKRPNLQAFDVAYDTAVSEEIDARRRLKATRIKIESLQSLIGRMKNAISVEDIDARIHHIEHRMQHETMSLKEEKQSIREIKQLKQHREYLSSNIGSQDEIQQALDQKDQNEDRMKVLKKELIDLKEKVVTAQAAAAAVGKKYEVENKLVQELQNQYRVANDVRQAAYENLLSLKKKLYEKNEYFRKYKNDVATASNYAFSRNKLALHRLCAGQMEMMMELWNNDEEFREEYIRCNLRSTVRRLGTVDGRSLGPNEEPPMLPSYAIVRVDRSTSYSDKSSSVVETAVEKKTEAKIATIVAADHKPVKEVTGSVKQTIKMLEPERSRPEGLASSSGAEASTGTKGQTLQEKEEHESARKVEDLRKEVETAKLKEQDRLDEIAKEKEELERKKLHEIAKAKEALERKKRIAEKAQIRAELRAQKEAEQREKEREKRLKKKERRRTGAGEDSESSNLGEIGTSSEAGSDTVKEPSEVKENPVAVVKRSQKPSQFVKQSKSKSIPPPLRNRNRKRLQQWMWVIFSCVLVIILFLLGNIGVFSKVRAHRSGY